MNSVPKLFSCSYADCWTEKHFSTEFGVLTPNRTHSHTLFWGCVSRWFGRALAWHARGHRFDPGNLHTEALHEKSRSAFYFVSKQVYHDFPNTVQDQSGSSQECSGCSTYNREHSPESIWSQSNTICTKSLRFIKISFPKPNCKHYNFREPTAPKEKL